MDLKQPALRMNPPSMTEKLRNAERFDRLQRDHEAIQLEALCRICDALEYIAEQI